MKRILFILFIGILSFFFLEIALLAYAKAVKQGRLYTNDNITGWRLIADRRIRRRFLATGEIKLCVTNKKGLPELTNIEYTPPADKYRIALTGDSIVEDFYNQGDKKRISQVLQERSGGCEVINLACGGWGTDQEYLFFKKEGYRYKPDLVILIVADNDYRDNASSAAASFSGRQKPVFAIEDGSLILKYKPNPMYGYLRDHSYVFNGIVRIYNRIRHRNADIMSGIRDFSLRRAKELTYKIIDNFHGFCKREGIDFIAVRVYSRKSLSEKKEDAPLMKYLDKRNIPHLDCFKYQIARDDQFYDGYHFSSLGTRNVAGAISGFLKSQLNL